MADWTDSELKRLEKNINAEYTKAYRSCKAEMSEIMARIQAHPEWTTEKRLLEMNKYNRLDNLCRQMADTLKDTNGTARRFINNYSANVYTHNYNDAAKPLGFDIIDNTVAKNILTEKVNPFTMISYEKMSNKALLVDNLKSEMISSLLLGESIPKMAQRIKSVTEKSLSDSIRIARTETTRVENSARAAIGDEGERLGFDMWKRWVATSDNRTRDAHADMDGVEVSKDEPFVVDGEELMFPGDISLGASAKNVCNCRCTVVYFIKGKAAKEKPENGTLVEEEKKDLQKQRKEERSALKAIEKKMIAPQNAVDGWSKLSKAKQNEIIEEWNKERMAKVRKVKRLTDQIKK